MTFRWGMVGHGRISTRFLDAVGVVAGAEVTVVAGRDAGRVAAYARERGIAGHHASVGEMLEAGGMDAVYVCTPHPSHQAAARACLEAGVPVLVEKPMTPTAADTADLVEAARASGTFLMEAMWTRFLPIYETIGSWIDQGRIGEVRRLSASFGFAKPFDADDRVFSADLAGGSVLDVGIYPLALAQWLFRSAPETLSAVGVVGESGVDEHVAVVARYPANGRGDGDPEGRPGLAQLGSAVSVELGRDAVINGSRGRIEIPRFWAAQTARLIPEGSEADMVTVPHPANGFEYEIREVMDCVTEGRTESTVMPLADSIELAGLCDEIRRQVGVRYPFESAGPSSPPD